MTQTMLPLQVAALRSVRARSESKGGGVVLGIANRVYPHQTVLPDALVDALLADLAV